MEITEVAVEKSLESISNLHGFTDKKREVVTINTRYQHTWLRRYIRQGGSSCTEEEVLCGHTAGG